MSLAKNLVFLVSICLSVAHAKFSHTYIDSVEERFYSSGEFDSQKMASFREQLELRRNEVFEIIKNERVLLRGQDLKKAEKKAKDKVENFDNL
jgi:hypothetical protein